MRRWSRCSSDEERIRPSETRAEGTPSTWRQMRTYAGNSRRGDEPSQPRQIFGECHDIVVRNRLHQVGHAGIVAAFAVPEVSHRLCQIVLVLAGERGWVPSPL